ncbi:MAG: YolD-like family protein [Halanaerobiales bacterium]|nr:YolD-like family protein [Halanaerobiales bacterium]
MDIKDRGNIKWTSLMLVEHRKKLEELKNNENKREKPDLDQQIYEVFNYRIKEAIEKQYKVKIIYYDDSKYREISTYIKKFDSNQKKLYLTDQKIKEIYFENIAEIILME